MARKRRFQRGSVKPRKIGSREVWYAQWRDKDGRPRSRVIGPVSQLTEAQATAALASILAPVNVGRQVPAVWSMAEYVERVFLPLMAQTWKDSTAQTSEQRIRQHIVPALRGRPIVDVQRAELQAFLTDVAPRYTRDTVSHLRWDLRQIFRLAVADRIIPNNPADALVIPSTCKDSRPRRSLSEDAVPILLQALGVRERLLCRLGIFEGLRIGEILGLQWGDIHGRAMEIRRRLYYGRINTPKGRKPRECALSKGTVALLAQWLQLSEWTQPMDWLFPSQRRRSPMRPENMLREDIRPSLVKHGLGWITFHELRHTNGTLMKKAGADVKVGADQRGHGVGVSLAVYTHSDLQQKIEAVDKLEALIEASVREEEENAIAVNAV